MNNRHPQHKNKTGPVRGETPQPGRWYEDRAKGREISSRFTAASGMTPTNPNNFESTKGRPSPFKYDAISDGLTTRVSPYGDGREFVAGEEPVLTTPGPTADMIASAEPAKGATDQPRTPGYGFAGGGSLAQIDAAQQQTPAAPAQPMGMSTGLSLGGGPQRNVPAPKSA
jgi:hypothetical protein